jgi:hypothetical protein
MAVGQTMGNVAQFDIGLYQDTRDVLDQTAPPTAPDGVIIPEFGNAATIAGKPSSFTAHGASTDYLGSYPGGARASQIEPDLTGPQLVSPARSADGYGMLGAGTPEPAINAPKQGAILDSRGYVHLGIGPAVPLALVAIIAGALYLTRHKGSITA